MLFADSPLRDKWGRGQGVPPPPLYMIPQRTHILDADWENRIEDLLRGLASVYYLPLGRRGGVFELMECLPIRSLELSICQALAGLSAGASPRMVQLPGRREVSQPRSGDVRFTRA